MPQCALEFSVDSPTQDYIKDLPAYWFCLSYLPSMPLYIRAVTPLDEPAVSRICLLTADAGKSAEPLFVNSSPELPGIVYAVPYLHLKSCWGFVLVDSGEETSNNNDASEKVVGYVIGSSSVRDFEADAAANWWPAARERFPLPPASEESKYNGTELYYFKTINNFPLTGQEVVDVYPAFLHINLLEGYRGAGWGSTLIRTAAEKVLGDGVEGLWVGIDSRNDAGRRFYLGIGFQKMESKEGDYYALDCQSYLDSGRGRRSLERS